MIQDFQFISRQFNWFRDSVEFVFTIRGQVVFAELTYEAQIGHFQLRTYPMSASGQLTNFDDNISRIIEIALHIVDAVPLISNTLLVIDACDVNPPARRLAA